MGIIERLLCKLFPHADIMRNGTQDLYLRRWFIYPRDKDFGKNKGKGRLYLHKFYRGDEDLYLHDHPWPFTSMILTRGYWEETLDFDAATQGTGTNACYSVGPDGDYRTQQWYRPFSILRRPAKWKHRVLLDNGDPVWTIVKTGPKERSWGFWVKGRLCPWRKFEQGVQWCEEGTVPEA